MTTPSILGGGSGMLTAPDLELTEWRERIRLGADCMVREQQLSVLDEVVRLRRAVRRLEKQLLVATQRDLFQDGQT